MRRQDLERYQGENASATSVLRQVYSEELACVGPAGSFDVEVDALSLQAGLKLYIVGLGPIGQRKVKL